MRIFDVYNQPMRRRVNIALPEETLRLIDQRAGKGGRSHFIDESVRHYLRAVGRLKLREQLKEGATRRAARDLSLAEDWFPIEEETWSGQPT
jgi:CopG family transcriptional regulator/antitoxin EndoAI